MGREIKSVLKGMVINMGGGGSINLDAVGRPEWNIANEREPVGEG